ncbi:hypothetical protein [Allostreptomyces psammosilenae]|uniref:Uncharacterized protein n=1 Tax=Allostreptomyces psammosilenae TaxID=1892865 RepID=A0A853AD15_9ACTN|nr:hypothetical protein [Allostreptomyces psammosilenae]NYI08338.1 hypothetical protein [Allostreptomyces psammosilenae]
MTRVLRLADPAEAAGLAAYLGRLVRWDRAAAVRLRAADGVLALFGNTPFGVLAVRAATLAPGAGELDTTVSAGELLHALPLDEPAAGAGAATASEGTAGAVGTAASAQAPELAVPRQVTGASWAGVLPPRSGWRELAVLPLPELRAEVARGVADFRARTEALAEGQRTRAVLDRVGEEIWSRTVAVAARPPGAAAPGANGTPAPEGFPLRLAHAAQALGFLGPAAPGVPAPGTGRDGAPAGGTGWTGPSPAVVLLGAGSWLRLRTPHGSTVLRRASHGLGLFPVR